MGATVACLAMATLVAGIVSYAAAANKSARAHLERTKAEVRLENGQFIAALGILGSSQDGRLRWTETRQGETFDILAEPEFAKASSHDASGSRLAFFAQIQAESPLRAAQYLDSGYARGKLPSIAQADESAIWRACAASVFSYYGRAESPSLYPAAAPDVNGQRVRSGEVWRIVVSSEGFTDERLVRLTDAGREPALLIDRDFRRGHLEGEQCESLFAAG